MDMKYGDEKQDDPLIIFSTLMPCDGLSNLLDNLAMYDYDANSGDERNDQENADQTDQKKERE